MPAATRPDGRGHSWCHPRHPRRPGGLPPLSRCPMRIFTPPPRLSVLGAALPLSLRRRPRRHHAQPDDAGLWLDGTGDLRRHLVVRTSSRTTRRRAGRPRVRTHPGRGLAPGRCCADRRGRRAPRRRSRPVDDGGVGARAALVGVGPHRIHAGEGPHRHRRRSGSDVAERRPRPSGPGSGLVIGICERGTTALVGPPEATRPVARAIIATAMTRFTPHDLRVILPSVDRAEWSWSGRPPLQTRGCTPHAASGRRGCQSFPGHTIALVRTRHTCRPTVGAASSSRLRRRLLGAPRPC